MGVPKWLVYTLKSHYNGSFGGTPMTQETTNCTSWIFKKSPGLREVRSLTGLEPNSEAGTALRDERSLDTSSEASDAAELTVCSCG